MGNLIRLFLLVMVASFFSCEKEDECVGCNLNPKIKLKFEALATRTLTDSLFTAVKGKITDYVDSLETPLADEIRNSILDELNQLREDSLKYGENYNLFRLGRTKISEIKAPGALNLEQFQDSTIRDFSIPIDLNHDTSTFYFVYHELADTLQLHYRREITQTFDGVRMRLYDIGVNEEITTFDSVRVKCYNVDCGNDLTTVYLYF